MLFLLPAFVKKVLETLQNAGFEAYAVGGCVRDLCMGKVPHDYDVTTNATPDAVTALFSRTVPTGIAHGTVTVLSEGQPVEVTTYRVETDYTDARHPDGVVFVGNLTEDLARRDFTVNAMAYDGENELVDPFFGRRDLQAKVLRTVGDATKRFTEDALRIMRLFRFAAVLDFSVEEATFQAALSAAPLLEKISMERIAEEWRKALCGAHPERLSPLLSYGGLGFAGLRFDPHLKDLAALPPENLLRTAAGIVLCGEDPLESAAILRLSNREKAWIEALLPDRQPWDENTRVGVKHGLRLLGAERMLARILFRKACGLPSAEPTLLADILQSGEPYEISRLALCGEDLKHCGFAGKEIGNLLEFLCEKVTEDPRLNQKETLLRLAQDQHG